MPVTIPSLPNTPSWRGTQRNTGTTLPFYPFIPSSKESCDSSVGIGLGYGLDDRGCSRVRFPAGSGNFSLHRFQNGSGSHPASYPLGTRGPFPGGKAVGVWI
jgi:hypothetical protein